MIFVGFVTTCAYDEQNMVEKICLERYIWECGVKKL